MSHDARMTSDRTILITRATGNQGVARSLQGLGFNLRGLTRRPDGERATLSVISAPDTGTAIVIRVWPSHRGHSFAVITAR